MRKIISLVLIIVTICSAFAALQVGSSAAVMAGSFTPRYSIPNKSNTWITKYNTSNNCTRYCYGRISEILNCDATSILGVRPDASSFPNILSKAGYSYGNTPKPGAVMCTSGHVAIVEEVDNANGKILISEGDSYTDVSKDRTTEKSLVDGISVMGYSTLTRESGKGHGTWFALRRININKSAKYYYIAKESPYFEQTQILLNNYNKIQVKFHVKNPSQTKISAFYTQIRVSGQSKWSSYKKTLSYTSGFYKTSTLASDGGCKYSISDGTTYEIRGAALSSSKTYYSDVIKVTTPARINIQNASLSGSSAVKYTGSNIAVSQLISVYYNGKKLTKGTDYYFSKDNIKNIGKHSITIYGKGAYKGSRTVKITVYPKTPTLNSLSYSNFTGRVSLKWARVADCSKQQIAVSKSSSFTNSNAGIVTVGSEKQSCSIYSITTVSGKTFHIEKGKTYYFKMRAYKIVGGEKIYGKWGAVKSIKCK